MAEAAWPALVREGRALLAAAGVPSPDVDARALAEFVSGGRLGLSGAGSVGTGRNSGAAVGAGAGASGATASEAEQARFRDLVARRAARIPLQHLTGRMYFRYLELESSPAALVVRPETEMVAEAAIAALRAAATRANPAPTALDIGTGSGAIALALATEVPTARVTAIDISADALALAERNNARYGNPVQFARADALDPELPARFGTFDVVVSNPPYVPAGSEISAEARRDPALALWGGGADGLEFPSALVRASRALLRPGGRLIVEHDERQGEAMRAAAVRAGYTRVGTGRDLTGRERWLEATAPGKPASGNTAQGAAEPGAAAPRVTEPDAPEPGVRKDNHADE